MTLPPLASRDANRRRPSRVITVVAAGFLFLDGVLLGLAGIWSERMGLIGWGAVFLAAGLAVVLYWRRYVRQLDSLRTEIEMQHRELMRLHREIGKSDDP